jgi:hypothetical protein
MNSEIRRLSYTKIRSVNTRGISLETNTQEYGNTIPLSIESERHW